MGRAEEKDAKIVVGLNVWHTGDDCALEVCVLQGSDPSLPHEFWRQHRKVALDEPTCALLRAVLEQTIIDIQGRGVRQRKGNGGASGWNAVQKRGDQADALAWLNDDKEWGIFSFAFIAREILGQDTAKFRRAILENRPAVRVAGRRLLKDEEDGNEDGD